MLKKGDMLLVGGLLLAVALYFPGKQFFAGNSTAVHRVLVVRQDNKVIRRIDLDASGKTSAIPSVKASGINSGKTERIKLSGDYNNVVVVENGRARFEDADCPDEVCVRTGWISKKGDAAVCLPNRVVIKIEGTGEKVDGVAG